MNMNMNHARKHDGHGGGGGAIFRCSSRPSKSASRMIAAISLVVLLVLLAWHSLRQTTTGWEKKSKKNAYQTTYLKKGKRDPSCLTVPEEDRDWIRKMHITNCKTLGYSQMNQDCTLDTIFQHIGTTNQFYVEYGFNTDRQCTGSGPNTCKLWNVDGWKGLLLDGSHENPDINLKAHYLYGNNAAQLLHKYKVPIELDFLSSDMDSHDYFVLSNILETFRPRIISTEYNANWPIEYEMSQVDPVLDPLLMEQSMNSFSFKECMWGASASAMKRLLEQNGYVLIEVVGRHDLFWARKDVVDCYDLPPFEFFTDTMQLGAALHKQQTDLSFLDWLADIQVWEETKDIDKARTSAKNKLVAQAKAAAATATAAGGDSTTTTTTTLPSCYQQVAGLLAAMTLE
jgi:hypothetical protein